MKTERTIKILNKAMKEKMKVTISFKSGSIQDNLEIASIEKGDEITATLSGGATGTEYYYFDAYDIEYIATS